MIEGQDKGVFEIVFFFHLGKLTFKFTHESSCLLSFLRNYTFLNELF